VPISQGDLVAVVNGLLRRDALEPALALGADESPFARAKGLDDPVAGGVAANLRTMPRDVNGLGQRSQVKVHRPRFGFVDLLASRPGDPQLAVQVTTSRNPAARLAKALALPALQTWLEAGCCFEVWGWSKRGPHGKRKVWETKS
jgi:hypothetical protein